MAARGGGYVYLPRVPGAGAWDAVSSAASNAYLAKLNPAVLPQGVPSQQNSYYNFSGQLDWNLGFATLTVLPAFRHEETANTSYNVQQQNLDERADQETLEVRLGNATKRLKWVAGLYFFNEVNPGRIRILIAPDILHTNIPYQPHGTSYAGFGEATLSLTDKLRLIGGARYTIEDRHLSGTYSAYPASDPTQLVQLEAFGGHVSFYSFTYRAGADMTSRRPAWPISLQVPASRPAASPKQLLRSTSMIQKRCLPWRWDRKTGFSITGYR